MINSDLFNAMGYQMLKLCINNTAQTTTIIFETMGMRMSSVTHRATSGSSLHK